MKRSHDQRDLAGKPLALIVLVSLLVVCVFSISTATRVVPLERASVNTSLDAKFTKFDEASDLSPRLRFLRELAFVLVSFVVAFVMVLRRREFISLESASTPLSGFLGSYHCLRAPPALGTGFSG